MSIYGKGGLPSLLFSGGFGGVWLVSGCAGLGFAGAEVGPRERGGLILGVDTSDALHGAQL